MTKFWCVVMLVVIFIYGPFLVIQSQIEVWPSRQFHATAQLLGGIAMLLWGARYFIQKPKFVVYLLDAYVIATLTGLTVLIPLLLLIFYLGA